MTEKFIKMDEETALVLKETGKTMECPMCEARIESGQKLYGKLVQKGDFVSIGTAICVPCGQKMKPKPPRKRT